MSILGKKLKCSVTGTEFEICDAWAREQINVYMSPEKLRAYAEAILDDLAKQFVKSPVENDDIASGAVTLEKLAEDVTKAFVPASTAQTMGVYCHDLSNGVWRDKTIPYSPSKNASHYTIVQRDGNGHILVRYPTSADHAASKDYVDSIIKELSTILIADGAVTESKIANNAVTLEKIADNSINGAKLCVSAVRNEHLLTGCVSTDKLSRNAVHTDKIKDGNVTREKLSEGVLDEIAAMSSNIQLNLENHLWTIDQINDINTRLDAIVTRIDRLDGIIDEDYQGGTTA